MADVKITFEEVKTKANEIHTCNVNLDQALKDIKTNITSLDAQWTCLSFCICFLMENRFLFHHW